MLAATPSDSVSTVSISTLTSAAAVTPKQLQEAFAEFLDIDIGAGDASADTIVTYRRQVQQFVNWCDRQPISPVAVSKDDIKRYRRWLIHTRRFKPATVALKLSVLRRFYQAAVERNLLPANPVLGIKPPREKRDPATKITFLEPEELQKLLKSIPQDGTLKTSRDRCLIAIMALEGPRTVELHRANIADLMRQGRNQGIRVEGKRSLRVVPLTEQLAQLLERYLQLREEQGEKLRQTSPLFVVVGNRARGQRISRRGIRQIVDHYLEQAALKYQPGRTLSTHSLRHTAGTLALRAGAELRQVQDLLGHADPRTTAIYTHVDDRWVNNPANRLAIELDDSE